jgi:uncharacterized iron-regulated protein
MKTLLCSDLGGPEGCDVAVQGETFEELGNNCKQHVMEMLQTGDQPHLAAVEKMKNASPEEQQKMFAAYQQKFEEASEE